MAGVPYVFASATTSIPLSELDVNFNTPVTIGNTTVGLGNTVTSFGNVTLTNATISGNLTATSITGGTANGVVYLSSGNVVAANPSVLSFTGTNLGIGTSSPSTALTVNGALSSIGPSSIYGIYRRDTNAYVGGWYSASGTITLDSAVGAALNIDTSGNLLVGTTSNAPSPYNNARQYIASSLSGLAVSVTNTGYSLVNFFYNNATLVGYITTNGTGTTYATASDYRLKENVVPMTGALETLAQLKPVTYKWKSDGSSGQGFIAHELQSVVPDAVVGEKDAVDEEGNPKYQGIDVSFLVATLTAAIQELSAQVTALQAKVAALTPKS